LVPLFEAGLDDRTADGPPETLCNAPPARWNGSSTTMTGTDQVTSFGRARSRATPAPNAIAPTRASPGIGNLRNDMRIRPVSASDILSLAACISAPLSRGELPLTPRHVHTQPVLSYSYLRDERDRQRLLDGIRPVLDPAEHDALCHVLGDRVTPTEDPAPPRGRRRRLDRGRCTHRKRVDLDVLDGTRTDPRSVVGANTACRAPTVCATPTRVDHAAGPARQQDATTVMLAERLAALMHSHTKTEMEVRIA
jgi:hypothetical protein